MNCDLVVGESAGVHQIPNWDLGFSAGSDNRPRRERPPAGQKVCYPIFRTLDRRVHFSTDELGRDRGESAMGLCRIKPSQLSDRRIAPRRATSSRPRVVQEFRPPDRGHAIALALSPGPSHVTRRTAMLTQKRGSNFVSVPADRVGGSESQGWGSHAIALWPCWA